MAQEVIVVVGAGVIGLTCGVRLAEAGYAVRVLTRDSPLTTTSAVAAAVWLPYRVKPSEQVKDWARETYAELTRLATEEPASGVRLREMLLAMQAAEAAQPEPPWWADGISYRRAAPEQLPADCGWPGAHQPTVPVAESPIYLPWLMRRLAAARATIELRTVGNLAEASRGANLLVHCSGVDAWTLAGDKGVSALRGQVVLVEPCGLNRVLADDRDAAKLTYLIPRRDACVVGGTAESIRDDPPSADRRPNREITEAILDRARALFPRLGRTIEAHVGLRPAREEVRLDLVRPAEGPPVLHCYGHGGSGLTLSWGCADEVLALVRAALA